MIASFELVSAQDNLRIDHITPEDGLSYRWVFDVFQDSHGFMWFTTSDGLNRYDGTQFRIYKNSPSDSTSMSDNQTFKVAEDTEGNIWVTGEDLFMNRLSSSSGVFDRIDLFQGMRASNLSIVRVIEMMTTSSDDFWIISAEIPVGDNKSIMAFHFWKHREGVEFNPVVIIKIPHIELLAVTEAAGGKFWVWTRGAGYYLMDPASGTAQHFPIPKKDLRYPNIPIDRDRHIWIPSGISEQNLLCDFNLPAEIEVDLIDNLRTDNLGNLWIYLNQVELVKCNVQNKSLEFFTSEFFKTAMSHRSLSQNQLPFFVDSEGANWIGHFYGALKFKKKEELFRRYLNIPRTNSGLPITGVSARSMTQSEDRFIWLRDQARKLYRLDLNSNRAIDLQFRPVTPKDKLSGGYGTSLVYDPDGYIWQVRGSGMVKMDRYTGLYEKIPYSVSDGSLFNFAPTHETLFRDRQGQFWVCDRKGSLLLNSRTGELSRPEKLYPIDQLNVNFTYSTYDAIENVIYAQYELGIYVIDCAQKSFELIKIFNDPIESTEILSFLKWKDLFWLGTREGLIKFDPQTGQKTIITKADGLPHNIIYSVLNSESALWLGTHNGLCQFNPFTQKMTTYYEEQGLPHNEFNRWSSLKTSDGQLFFGGLNGVIGFDPKDFKIPAETIGSLHLVEINRYDQKSDTIVRMPIFPGDQMSELVLRSNERTISFHYALTMYDDLSKNQYYHYMEGLEPTWIEDGSQTSIRYLQVPPGKYTFRVRATGPRKIPADNELVISLVVLQVWYLRWWAWVAYTLAVGFGIFSIYRIQLSRQLDKQEAARMRELDQVKTKMYTNITHEFRTPLTVMLGMNDAVEDYARNGNLDKILHAKDMINRSGQNLLSLVNQMLDLSKLETGQLVVNFQQADIQNYLKYLIESFKSYATDQNITVHFHSDEEAIIMDFDPEKISHVLNNLILNAIKFTPKKGNVYINLCTHDASKSQSVLELRVRDTGIGIPADELENIFDRFYQVDDTRTRKGEGTGIGLSLVRELVKLLNGNIEVKSKVDLGTEFIVTLPIANQAPLVHSVISPDSRVARPLASPTVAVMDGITEDDQRPLVLIVEDNPDVVHYLRISVEGNYRTAIANNGSVGIEKAIELIPDLIISDVMMPEKDGFELCEAVKKDERTSHIPVILLTAKADVDSRIKGLEHGADAYLSKPFNKQELLVRLKNLFELRAALQRRYSQSGSLIITKMSESNKENDFLIKVQTAILENLSDEDFGIVQLCGTLHISRVQLHRKLKALTDRSTSHFIRSIRLERARELLAAGELNVSEVAYEVGFKNQSHFSRTFAEAFGMPPSECKPNI